MIPIKLIHLTLLLWSCGLYDKAGVDCHKDHGITEIRHKRLTSEVASEVTSDKDLLKGLVLEALELENNFWELNKSSNVTELYQRLIDRIKGVTLHEGNKDNERALSHLLFLLRHKLIDMEEEPSLIVDVDSYATVMITKIELKNRSVPAITNIYDVDLENNLNKLRLGVNGNFILNEYQHYIEAFRLSYLPYAACYLESLRLPNSPTAYDNLDAMTLALTSHLNESKRNIEDINMRDVGYLEGRAPEDAFYIWKSPDVRDKIHQLFKGEKITLLADVKTAPKQLNAVKFNELYLVFRSSNQTVNNRLNRALKAFLIHLKHSGRSAYRYNNHFYQVTSTPLLIFFSYERLRQQDGNGPVHRNGVYTKLRDNRPMLSPYTEWELRLSNSFADRFHRLTPFEQFDIDIELHGRGTYVEEVEDDEPICEEEKLFKFYKQMEN